MAPQDSASALGEGFVSIGEGLYLRTPQPEITLEKNNSTIGVQPPNIILIFGWMAAKLRHLHKYTQIYTRMYPHATQILVRSFPSFFWSSNQAREARLAPVITALQSLGGFPTVHDAAADHGAANITSNARILIHVFSNGGSYQLVTLCRILSYTKPLVALRIPTAIIFDSCPGNGGLTRTIRAFTVAVPNRIFKFLIAIFLSIVHASALLRSLLFGTKGIAQILLDALLNPHLIPWADDVPRLYLYSKKDELIPWNEIQRHVKAVETAGLDVRYEIFEGSAHVQHGRDEPERYWKAVTGLWKVASSR